MKQADTVEPKINPNDVWEVTSIKRRSACDNRPGLKKMYVRVLDAKRQTLYAVRIRFDTEPSYGIVYDHPNFWGPTDEWGYLEWDHTGRPTRYRLWIEDHPIPLIENIRTDLGYEYCRPPGSPWWSGRRPVNRPGVYSYDIEIQRKY